MRIRPGDRIESASDRGKDDAANNGICSMRRRRFFHGEVLLMQTVIIQRRIELLPTLSRSGKRINGLHRLMRSPYLFERAYEKVSLNKGALTPGVDGKTFDGMSLTKLADIARRVADGTYRFRPVRRVHIPKDNGKTRPLGIPTVEDRLVQEAVRIILEAIYEPVFLDEFSMGPARGSPVTPL